jgi:hypothetical protein
MAACHKENAYMAEYTLMDLEQAYETRKAVEAKWERYDGNNPNKYRSERRAAQDAVLRIEESLKAVGALERTPEERLDLALDTLHPDTRAKEVVEHDGVRYERRFQPLGRFTDGKPERWKGYWVELPPG